MIVNPNIQAALKDRASNNVWDVVGSGAPTNGTSGTGAGKFGPGSKYTDTATGNSYTNVGTKASPTWQLSSGSVLRTAEVSITNAEMLALRAAPKELVAAPGAGKVIEFVSMVLLFDRTAAYTETADNMAVKYVDGSGTAISVAIESTGFVDAAADAVYFAMPLAGTVLGVKTLFENQKLVLHNTGDGEFGGGNAANVVRAKVTYRIWSTGF